MTSENIDALRFKIIVRQSCLNFGAVETAKKLQDHPKKLEVLLQLLITEDLIDSAYLLGQKFLSEEDFKIFSERSEFADVNKETVKVSQVTGNLHEQLTGESILETRKKLRKERREAAKAKKAAKKALKQAKKPTPAKGVVKGENAKSKKVKEIPTHDKNGKEFLTLSEFDFKRENYFFVPTGRSFLKIKDHFLEQSVIGFDAEYHLGRVSTITLASEDMVSVLDMISLRKNKEVIEYVKNILLNENIEKVTHTFRTDAYFLSEQLEIDPHKIAKVLDLTEIVKEEGSENRIGLRSMVEKFFDGKTLNQYYKKSHWDTRPIEQSMIDYAALNGFVVLKMFLLHDENNSEKGMKYYTYEPPKNIPDYSKKIQAESVKNTITKQKQKKAKKSVKTKTKNTKTTPEQKTIEVEESTQAKKSNQKNTSRGGRRPTRRRGQKYISKPSNMTETAEIEKPLTKSRIRGSARGRGSRGGRGSRPFRGGKSSRRGGRT